MMLMKERFSCKKIDDFNKSTPLLLCIISSLSCLVLHMLPCIVPLRMGMALFAPSLLDATPPPCPLPVATQELAASLISAGGRPGPGVLHPSVSVSSISLSPHAPRFVSRGRSKAERWRDDGLHQVSPDPASPVKLPMASYCDALLDRGVPAAMPAAAGIPWTHLLLTARCSRLQSLLLHPVRMTPDGRGLSQGNPSGDGSRRLASSAQFWLTSQTGVSIDSPHLIWLRAIDSGLGAFSVVRWATAPLRASAYAASIPSPVTCVGRQPSQYLAESGGRSPGPRPPPRLLLCRGLRPG
jgi:hypothetical protein